MIIIMNSEYDRDHCPAVAVRYIEIQASLAPMGVCSLGVKVGQSQEPKRLSPPHWNPNQALTGLAPMERSISSRQSCISLKVPLRERDTEQIPVQFNNDRSLCTGTESQESLSAQGNERPYEAENSFGVIRLQLTG